MSAVLTLNILLAAAIFAAVIGLLGWAITTQSRDHLGDGLNRKREPVPRERATRRPPVPQKRGLHAHNAR